MNSFGSTMRKTLVAVILMLFGLAAWANSAAQPAMLWVAHGVNNRVYLLGSIHLLREKDHPLPSIIDVIYEDVDQLVMELDMDDIDAISALTTYTQLGVLRDATTLRDLVGEELYAQAFAAAEAVDIPLDLLEKSEPWLAAMVTQEMLAMRVGFNATLGVEQYLTNKALIDGKPIVGLETVAEQLSFLDGLSVNTQSQWFVHSLVEGLRVEMLADQLVTAWRSGDVRFLEKELLHEAKMSPELHEALLLRRNRDWIDKIVAYLDDDIDYLVVVGAAHLVGEDGVPDLLSRRGVNISQLSSPE